MGSSWLRWSNHFESFSVATMTWLTVMVYLCHKYVPLVVNTSRSFPHSWLTNQVCNQINTTGTTIREGTDYTSGPPELIPDFSGVRVTRSLVVCVCFIDRCLSFYSFSFGHCVVCSSIYGFKLPLVSSNSSYCFWAEIRLAEEILI